jgi:hypothetical protein
MEKYGVKQVETLPANGKQASDTSKCPLCNAPLAVHGSVRICKTHGSLPFEKSTHED